MCVDVQLSIRYGENGHASGTIFETMRTGYAEAGDTIDLQFGRVESILARCRIVHASSHACHIQQDACIRKNNTDAPLTMSSSHYQLATNTFYIM
mmetsp:Transcript_6379/g.15892  ORF Transcript_6379/g.15892 Transcript_6379/m.15892 type:complete len:95 (-) Transcript_6379:74-358(-)